MDFSTARLLPTDAREIPGDTAEWRVSSRAPPMIVRPHLHWFRLLFVWRGSVLPYIVTRLLLVSAVSVLSVLGRGWWMRIHPESALSIPPMMFSRVDLPEPEGPSRTQISPRATENVIPRRTSCRVSPLP